MKVIGIEKKLSHGGSVFIGTDEEDKTNTNLYFEFVNANGEHTRLGLSREAWEALKEVEKKLFPVEGWVLKGDLNLSWTGIGV